MALKTKVQIGQRIGSFAVHLEEGRRRFASKYMCMEMLKDRCAIFRGGIAKVLSNQFPRLWIRLKSSNSSFRELRTKLFRTKSQHHRSVPKQKF